VRNPNPIARARRIETRRKQLAYPDRCFYCSESDISCFEEDHPVTRKLDPKFKRVVCRNDHWKLERKRDDAKLTKNGLHEAKESGRDQLVRYLLLLAEDQESIADVLESPVASLQMTAKALRSTAASLRRRANSSSQPAYAATGDAALEWDGTGCA
jgi:hypothetical protein